MSLSSALSIEITDLGKRFNRHWVFRHINYTFNFNNSYAVIGYNGSGKSTLLQVLAGAVSKSQGTITYKIGDKIIPEENHFKYLSIATPYIELIEELTLTEFLEFHHQFKPLMPQFTIPQLIDLVGLTAATGKQIRYFSSGMKQRVKLLQAIFSNSPLVLLDEPTSNLDKAGIELYNQLIQDYCLQNRLLIVCSNDENEIGFCNHRLDVTQYKEV